jgi:hypothetical protein
MKTILLLTVIALSGCSTVSVKQKALTTTTFYKPDGTIDRIEERSLANDVTANGDGTAAVTKLRANQTKSGTMGLGAEGVNDEVTSPVALQGVKDLFTLLEVLKGLQPK